MDTEADRSHLVAVSLSVYDWHRLLRELETALTFANVDTSHARYLYEAISGQLSETPVRVRIYER